VLWNAVVAECSIKTPGFGGRADSGGRGQHVGGGNRFIGGIGVAHHSGFMVATKAYRQVKWNEGEQEEEEVGGGAD
jgi:hypothetical protein